jgi:multidrug efflux pump subunit AcrA (membrane-fusion protein)
VPKKVYLQRLFNRVITASLFINVNYLRKTTGMKILSAGLCLTIMLGSCDNNAEKTNPLVSNITESVYASGIVKTKNQYQVFPTVSGIIKTILVTENDIVKKGSPLLLISNETSRISRENASLAASYSDLGSNEEKLADLRNNIAFAQSRFQNDSAIFKRQQSLWEQNIGSRLDLEQKELAYKNSATALESAKMKYSDVRKQLTFNSLQSKNNLAISKKNEGDFTIRSEINGKVYSLYREPGEIVNPQTTLALVGDASVFLLELQVDEYDIAKIREGQSVLVSMDSYKGQVFKATVSKIYPTMNERSKSFSVEAVFLTQPPVLYPNLTAEANIVIQEKKRVLTIPVNYLVNDSTVLISKNKTRVVKTGLKDYQKVEILNGLTAGDIIYKPQ